EMCASSSEKDLYGVLGASPSENHEILKQFILLYIQCHPDRLSGHETEVGLKRFLEVDAAWKILSDKNKRRDYDLQRRARDLKQDWPVDSTVFLEDMAWNNDERLYTHCCRCGGAFIIDEEESRGVIVCCDTCSLSVYVTWTNPPQS
uniref:DnaJ (Hsp40) homolog, subfamily C, member 24 n=1 Tax=Periophthalmus magnuspinnatus TaxID=409849 RepID=A0A3B4BEY4_9GOBI